jgi:hypothetical protein
LGMPPAEQNRQPKASPQQLGSGHHYSLFCVPPIGRHTKRAQTGRSVPHAEVE